MTRSLQIPAERRVLASNDEIADDNRRLLDRAGVLALNLMASPGAGKTTLILATAGRLIEAGLRPGVVEGDLATRIDADRVAAAGIPVIQINTDGGCHLDASMVRSGLEQLPLDTIDLLFVENVGNLVCPANFRLGTHANAVIASVPEGDDKPYKYPGMYAAADVVLLNKFDLAGLMEYDESSFREGVRLVNPSAPVFALSSRTGTGIERWIEWLLQARRNVEHG